MPLTHFSYPSTDQAEQFPDPIGQPMAQAAVIGYRYSIVW